MGIEWFISRRSTPIVVWSDNGTNFVGAEKQLPFCVQNWNRQALALSVYKGIKLKYNPLGAPHQCGSWERLVCSCKYVFYANIGTRKLMDEALSTTFSLVEQLFNARPITPVG